MPTPTHLGRDNGPRGLCQTNAIVSKARQLSVLKQECAPFGQCVQASLFVDLAADEMPFQIKVVVHLSMN
jgi:hypothetical protein